ncbi:diguanylate cyclase domain-containing protein [Bacillus massiliigorillae]|uniref:diguanylate cyclase domain-containing protein n=1 Tax=Bacillus massiliigorillae TaxID=1243664 RepID=UPI0003A9CABB|nr:diguanylate cyclase [Bacillus massiliigorillae]
MYRLSGDEFICISLGDEKNNTYIKRKIEEINAMGERPFIQQTPFLGVSSGIVSLPKGANTVEALIKLADQLMYRNKGNRRRT